MWSMITSIPETFELELEHLRRIRWANDASLMEREHEYNSEYEHGQ